MMSRLTILLTIVALWASSAAAQQVERDDFEGPEASFVDGGGDASYRIEFQRVQQVAHAGRWSEHITLAGNNGTYVYASRPLRPARVIQELAVNVWLKADRPGIQLAVRVVLPRSPDPRTGKPLTTLLRGASYQKPGSWQLLTAADLPKQLDRQVRVLRTQFGPDVDAREAYVDRLLLNVYGGPGTTNAWVDDLEVAGVVGPEAAGAPLAQGAVPQVMADNQVRPAQYAAPANNRAGNAANGSNMPRVELRGPLLLVGGKPFFPRAIDYQGESLARLQAIGFNTIRVQRIPPPALLVEASRLGLWVICPPPNVQELEARGNVHDPVIGAMFDPVLVWDLGRGLASRELEATRHWAKLVQEADPRDRPILCDADSDLRSYTRPPIKLLLAERDPIGTSLSMAQYGSWLQERNQLALGGTPLWAAVQTELAPQWMDQVRLLSQGRALAPAIQEAQLRNLIHTALAARARGLCFTSHTRLDAEDPVTRRRATVLELLNLELELIDRWPASGNFAATAGSNDRLTSGAVMETDRSRLVLPISTMPQSQYVQGVGSVSLLKFLVTGVPEGDNAYELSPTSLRPLPSKRVAGGTEVILGEAERDSLVVFTQDQVVIGNLKTRLAKTRARAAQLVRDLARDELLQVDAIEQRLTDVGRALPATKKVRTEVEKDLRKCDEQLGTDVAAAYFLARRAQQNLRVIERAHWDQAITSPSMAIADPLAATFTTLPDHFRLLHELNSLQRGPNVLAQGNFESLGAMLHAGWKHYEHRQENVDADPAIVSTVDLAAEAAHGGKLGLRMRALPRDPENKPNVIETPPLWVTSAAVPVQQGDLIELQGWVNVPGPIVGSVDGLLIIDSLSGEPLAQRLSDTQGWRQFVVHRAAPRSGPLQITFALSGMGEAWIDEVTIQILRRQPAAPPQQQAQQGVAPPQFAR